MSRTEGTARRLRKFLSLPRSDQAMVAEAAVALGATRLGLWLLSARRLLKVTSRVARWTVRGGKGHDGSVPARVGRAVAMAATCVPRASCLPQALAAQFLLERRGYSPAPRIGMARNAEGRLVAHAWVEHEGVVILGNGFPPEILLPMLTAEGADGR